MEGAERTSGEDAAQAVTKESPKKVGQTDEKAGGERRGARRT
jgi:hypothetical protein